MKRREEREASLGPAGAGRSGSGQPRARAGKALPHPGWGSPAPPALPHPGWGSPEKRRQESPLAFPELVLDLNKRSTMGLHFTAAAMAIQPGKVTFQLKAMIIRSGKILAFS